ncbi:chemotaxis protein CheW [Desulfuromonas thiophila]|uniref:chemotaxis protein CheA n=1 Tax=Desulfuromonas thiophila TaxID=57664 RepID=UPI0029F5B416|nr:chemotaxis protein CheW [Desulfuromonas thiophila]
MDDLQQALLAEFLAENAEALRHIETGLLQLERQPRQQAVLHEVFRAMHTVKGNCQMLGFAALQQVAHGAETVLEAVRDGRRQAETSLFSLLLEGVDLLRQGLAAIAGQGPEPDGQPWLQRLAQTETATSSTVCSGSPAPALPPVEPLEEGFVRLPVRQLDDFLNALSGISAELGLLRQRYAGSQAVLATALEETGERILRLQDEVLSCRLEPIGQIWQPYQRLVRDLALQTGKRVLLTLEGEQTRVDRAILMALKDPLGHLLRNAVDHGLETPAERQVSGKPVVGQLQLQAWHEQGQVVVELRDDGCGLDLAKIRATAQQRRLLEPEALARLDEAALQQLIFLPGFSTREVVSTLSGRGAGLDVVKTALEQVGGQVLVESQAGQGCCFRLLFPRTMALVATLLVRVASTLYALPQAQVVEVLSLDGPQARRQWRSQLGRPALNYRQQCLELCSLAAGGGVAVPAEGRTELVVVQLGSERLAVQVDQVLGSEQLVIKPLHRLLWGITRLSGSAVLADGRIVFLLDLAVVRRQARAATTT